MKITPQSLVEAMDISHGDTILVASDVQRIQWETMQNNPDTGFDYNELISLMQEKISKNGTILFPTYNWDFCHGIAFDYHKSKSHTGSLSQIALDRKDFIRTRHPIYSFAVWGKDAQYLYEMNDENSFLGNTPFDYLYKKKNAKMITIDVDLTHCFTFVHYAEEVNNVAYRFKKNFECDYIDENAQKNRKKYSMYVRNLDVNGIVDFDGLERIMYQKKIMKKNYAQDILIRSLLFEEAYIEIENDIQNNNSMNIVRL